MAFSLDSLLPPALWNNGPIPGGFYSFPGHGSSTGQQCKSFVRDYAKRSQAPITTTTTVIGVKFDKGVIIAGDTLGSYGSLARFRDCPRVFKANDNILIGAGGDYGDFQFLQDVIEQKIIDEQCLGDGILLKPRSMHCWLTRVLYNRRSKLDPLWNNYVVAGMQDGVPFLGTVDKLGTAYEDAAVATGLGAYMATPLIREATEGAGFDEKAARELVKKCLKVLFYRDARSFPRYQMGVVTADGVKIDEPTEIDHQWELANHVEMK